MSRSYALSARPMEQIEWSRDRIEEQIVRAYIRLALAPGSEAGSRTVTLVQFGALEVRLTETAPEGVPSKVPPLWLEIYSHVTGAVVDSCGCFEFDEDELKTAVDLVVEAQQGQPALS